MTPAPQTWRTRPVLSAIAAVALAKNVSPKQLRKNGSRFHYQVRDRWIVWWLARQQGASLGHIGYYTGFNHTTVLIGLKRAERLRDIDPEFRQLSDTLLAKLEGRP